MENNIFNVNLWQSKLFFLPGKNINVERINRVFLDQCSLWNPIRHLKIGFNGKHFEKWSDAEFLLGYILASAFLAMYILEIISGLFSRSTHLASRTKTFWLKTLWIYIWNAAFINPFSCCSLVLITIKWPSYSMWAVFSSIN